MPNRRKLVLFSALAALALGLITAFSLTGPSNLPEFQYVIPAGQEASVLRFLEPLLLGAPVADGYVLSNVSIEGGVIQLSLDPPPGGARATVELVHPSEAPGMTPVGGVVVRTPSETPAAVGQSVRHALDRVPAPASPWVAVKRGKPEPLSKRLRRSAADFGSRVRNWFQHASWGTAFFQGLWSGFMNAVHRSGHAISGAWDSLGDATRRALSGFANAFVWLGRAIWGTLTGGWSAVARFFGDDIPRVLGNGGHVIGNWLGNTGHACSHAFGVILDATLNVFTTPENLVGATAIALGVAVALLTRERVRSIPGPMLAGLLGLTAFAVLLRLTLSPRSFLHEYYHVYETWRNTFVVDDRPTYGLAGPVLYRTANRVFGGEERAIFLANAGFASLTVPIVALCDRALFGSWPRAFAAGLAVCLLPVHLRFSASEELWILATLLAYVSLTAWALWLKRPSRTALAVTVLALALGMQTRPELLPLPLAHLGLLLVMRPRREWQSVLLSKTALIGLGTLVLLLSFRLASLVKDRGTMPSQALPSWWMLTSADTLVDWAVMPRAVVLLGCVGLVLGMWRHPKASVWLLLLTAAYVVMPLTAFQNRPCIYRTQMFAMTLVAMSAAGVVEAIPGGVRWRAAAVGAFALVCAQGLWTRRAFVTELRDQQLEVAFLGDAVPRLPEQTTMIALFRNTGAVPKQPDWMGEFPSFFTLRNHKVVEEANIRDFGALDWPAPRPGLVFYQGMYCYVSGSDQVPLVPMRPECLAVHERYQLRPIVTRALNTTGYSTAFYSSAPFELGFFEVTGLRTVGAKG